MSDLARRQMDAWQDTASRLVVARKLISLRFPDLTGDTIEQILGREGLSMAMTYKTTAQALGIPWVRRAYDREDPSTADIPNQALNHASSALTAMAGVAVAATATIPQLGFLHTASSHAWELDVADIVKPWSIMQAFIAVKQHMHHRTDPLERIVRQTMGQAARRERIINTMIEYITQVLA